jgi:rRNA maturation endonuclease Nob1
MIKGRWKKMIKEQELIDELQEYLDIEDTSRIDLYPEDVQMCIDALEKQIAKKPYIWGDGYYNGELILDMYDCPNCEKTYEIECDKYDYCPSCGQKLDLSEVE